MDLGITIIGIIIILTCILPFILNSIKKRKQHKKVIDNLSNIAKMNDATIEINEIWNQSAIGIDAKKKILFYSEKAEDDTTFKVLNLCEVQKCSVVKFQDKHQSLQRLDLTFDFFDKNKSEKSIAFYNENVTTSLVNELELIEKWNGIIIKNL